MINDWNFLEAFFIVTTCLWYVCRYFYCFSSPQLFLGYWLQGWLLSANQQMAGNGWNWLAGSSGCLGVLPHPICQSFTKNNPFDENNENKLNKIGLLQNPIGIGTRLCRTSMWTLRSDSRWLFTVLHIFLACRVPWVSPIATGWEINQYN